MTYKIRNYYQRMKPEMLIFGYLRRFNIIGNDDIRNIISEYYDDNAMIDCKIIITIDNDSYSDNNNENQTNTIMFGNDQ